MNVEGDHWWHRAACRNMDTSWWFPAKGDQLSGRVARMICAGCAVRPECLSSALAEELATEGQPSGIRGGVTGQQRAVMLAAMRSSAATTVEQVPVAVAPSGRRAWTRYRTGHYAEAL